MARKHLQRREWLTSVAALGLAPGAWAAEAAAKAPATPPALADFFGPGGMSAPVLSPDGKHLALVMGAPDGRRQLAVMNLEGPRQLRLLAGFVDADVAQAHWVNSQRLVFSIDDQQSAFADRLTPGLFAVDRDSDGDPAKVRQLIERDRGRVRLTRRDDRVLSPIYQLANVMRDGGDDITVSGRIRTARGDTYSLDVLRQNTRSGRVNTMADAQPPKRSRQWWADDQGQARLAVVEADDNQSVSVQWRERPGGDWQPLFSRPVVRPGEDLLRVQALGPDGRVYLVMVQPGDADGTSALYRVDATTQQPEAQPVLVLRGFDFHGRLIFDAAAKRLLGVRYLADTWSTAWLDADMQALQSGVDNKLPGLVNLIDGAECGCTPHLIVTSFSDVQPPLYWLLDRRNAELSPLGRARPRIDARRMARRELTRIAARDGLGLPVYLTRPAGTGPWPTVVLAHGGPWVRGVELSWSAQAQFLASRGYLVVEPEFRGSAGYGQRLHAAGFKQWGLKMQDDLADAARWAIAQGLADARRVAIMGTSYGGYAALMGLIQEPALFRAGISLGGITDLEALMTLPWSGITREGQETYYHRRVGHPVQDREMLRAHSPQRLAERLRAPLLLAHGEWDNGVPIDHALRLREALRPHNPHVDFVRYDNEAAGFKRVENRLDFWRRVEAFLARHLARA